MGLYMEFKSKEDFKPSKSSSPNTVLSTLQFHYLKANKGNPTFRNDFSSLDEDLQGNIFKQNVIGLESGQMGKRASVYQSSKDIRKMNNSSCLRNVKILEKSDSNDSYFPYRIVDPLHSLDEESDYVDPKASNIIVDESKNDPTVGNSSDGFFEIVLETRGSGSKCERAILSNVKFPYSPSKSDSDSFIGSPLAPLSPIRKIFYPFMKPKSHRMAISSHRNWSTKAFQKSILRKLPNNECKESGTSTIGSRTRDYIRGSLKFDQRHGVFFSEFALRSSPEEALVAKVRKDENNGFNCVYTFHSFPRSRKQWNLDSSSIVGQMHVLSYLSSETNESGCLEEFLVKEFVVYNTAHSCKSLYGEAPHNSLTNFLASEDLRSQHEIAAVVIKILIDRRENVKLASEGSATGKSVEKGVLGTKVKVVTPIGHHGLPDSEIRGVSGLLDRLKQGGGCDCGGWDLGCPLIVFGDDNHNNSRFDAPSHQLFVQGSKENMPALFIKHIEEGRYEVNFIESLSALQAFSICVVMLYGTKDSGHERIKMAIEDVKCLNDDNSTRPTQKQQPSFLVNPPVSPIARV